MDLRRLPREIATSDPCLSAPGAAHRVNRPERGNAEARPRFDSFSD
jgi:hypothetical protein